MDEKNFVLSLDLQFFAEDDPEPNPAQPNEPNPQNDGKKFTQEDLNRVNIKGKNDELKRILKATNFESEEALIAHLTKVKDYDEKVAKITEYEAKELKETYLAEIRKSNVADEYIETVYLALQPTENEKVGDYNGRVSKYLESHKALLKVNTANKFFNTDLGYNGKQNVDGNSILSLGAEIKAKMNRK